MAAVAVPAEQHVAEQVRFADVAVEDQRVGSGAGHCRERRGKFRLAASGRTFQVGVLLGQQRQGQPGRGVVLADEHPSQRRSQFNEGGGELRGAAIRGGQSHGGDMLLGTEHSTARRDGLSVARR